MRTCQLALKVNNNKGIKYISLQKHFHTLDRNIHIQCLVDVLSPARKTLDMMTKGVEVNVFWRVCVSALLQ